MHHRDDDDNDNNNKDKEKEKEDNHEIACKSLIMKHDGGGDDNDEPKKIN